MNARSALLIAVLAGGALAAEAFGAPAPTPRQLLPDLTQRRPTDVSVRAVRSNGQTRYRLGFTTVIANVGKGPLRIRGSRTSVRTPVMTARQSVLHANGSWQVLRARVGDLRYARAPDHSHWHLLGFDRYGLLRDRRLIRPDHKMGFCLGSRYLLGNHRAGALDPWADPFCARNRPGALEVREGIAPGWVDDYPAQVEGQYVDVTGVPAGRYVLTERVNAERLVVEFDYANNLSWATIRLGSVPPDGRAPSVAVLASCGVPRSCRLP